jgi:hypothetical protein
MTQIISIDVRGAFYDPENVPEWANGMTPSEMGITPIPPAVNVADYNDDDIIAVDGDISEWDDLDLNFSLIGNNTNTGLTFDQAGFQNISDNIVAPVFSFLAFDGTYDEAIINTDIIDEYTNNNTTTPTTPDAVIALQVADDDYIDDIIFNNNDTTLTMMTVPYQDMSGNESISGNTAFYGGGIYNTGTLNMENNDPAVPEPTTLLLLLMSLLFAGRRWR